MGNATAVATRVNYAHRVWQETGDLPTAARRLMQECRIGRRQRIWICSEPGGYAGRSPLMENRHGLIVDAMATTADGYGEREAATHMVWAQWARAPGRRRTLGADKAYDVRDVVGFLRELHTTPHVAQNVDRSGGSTLV